MSRPIFLDTDGEPIYNAGVSVQEMIDQLPAGLDRAILRIISFHVGHDNRISRVQFILDLKTHGFDYTHDDRIPRLCINKLRKEGVEICSTGGSKGGYWMANGHEELEEFLEHEVDKRAKDLHEQASAMRKAAEKRWGRYSPAKQVSMF